MNTRNRLGMLVLLLMLVLTTACGGGQTTGSSPNPEPGTGASGVGASSEGGGNPAAEAPKETLKLKVGYDGFSMTTAPMYYAEQKGIFDKYALDVELMYVKGGSTLTQATIGGDIEIAQNGYTPAAQAIVEGAKLVFIGGISNKLPFQMVVSSNISSAEDLKGKKIAISKFGSSTDKAAELVLESIGLQREDAVILQVGGSAERVAAAMTGQVDATMEQYPQTGDLLKTGSFKVLVDLTDLAGEYPNTGYVIKDGYLEDATNREKTKRFFQAMTEAIHLYKQDKQEAIRLTAEFLQMDDPSGLEETYQFYCDKVFPDIPKPTMVGIDLVLADLVKEKPQAANFSAAAITDVTIFDELEQEGFFKPYQQ